MGARQQQLVLVLNYLELHFSMYQVVKKVKIIRKMQARNLESVCTCSKHLCICFLFSNSITTDRINSITSVEHIIE